MATSQGFASDFSFFACFVFMYLLCMAALYLVQVDAHFCTCDSALFCMKKRDAFWVLFNHCCFTEVFALDSCT